MTAVIGCLPQFGAGATARTEAAKEYQQRVWKKEHGLPSNMVKALIQTHDGYLWIGTQSGVARFDGIAFTVFNKHNTSAFYSEECTVLAEDAEGTLWVGTSAGLLRRREGIFARVAVSEGMVDEEVVGLWTPAGQTVVGASNRTLLWALTTKGLFQWREGKFHRRRVFKDSKEASIAEIHQDQMGHLLISTSLGLREWNPQNDQLEDPFGPELARRLAPFIYRAARTVDGRLWFHRDNLLTLKQGEHFTIYTNTHPSAMMARSFLKADQSGNLWSGHAAYGLFRYREGQATYFDRSSGLSDESVSTMIEDSAGNLWFGTERGGLNCWQPRRCESLQVTDGLPDGNIWALCEGRDGSIWIGSDGGVSRWRGGEFTTYDKSRGLSRNTVRALCEDKDGALWIGTGDGLNRLVDGKLTVHPLPLSRWGYKIRAILEDRNDTLWVGWEHGLSGFIHGHWRHFSSPDDLASRVAPELDPNATGLPSNPPKDDFSEPDSAKPPPQFDVRGLLEDREGALWFGTFGRGVFRWLDGKVTAFTEKEGLSHNNAWVFHEDSDGVIWIGTEHGLNRFANGKLKAFGIREGLPDDLVNQILGDDFGNLWISHDRGIYRVRKRALEQIAEGRARTVECSSFDEAEGLPSGETNGTKSQPAGIKTRDGRLWFPTTRGVAIIDPRRVGKGPLPRALIEEIRANQELVWTGTGSIKLPPRLRPGSGHVLDVHYTASTFVSPEKLRFKYRLEGYEPEWRDAGTRRVAYFTNLRPGHYEFQVAVAGEEGSGSGPPIASVAFDLAPWFYQRWSFYLFCALALTGIGSALYRWRMRELGRMHELQKKHALAQELGRVSADLHDDLGSSLARQALLLEQIRTQIREEPELGLLDELSTSTSEITQKARDAIWATNPQCDTLDSLVSYLAQYAGRFLGSTNISCRLDIPVSLPPVPLAGAIRHHILLITKEALTNAARHSGATEVWVRVAWREQSIVLRIEDNGRGFVPPKGPAKSGGLENMRQRSGQIGGRIELTSASGKGTVVKIIVPIPES